MEFGTEAYGILGHWSILDVRVHVLRETPCIQGYKEAIFPKIVGLGGWL